MQLRLARHLRLVRDLVLPLQLGRHELLDLARLQLLQIVRCFHVAVELHDGVDRVPGRKYIRLRTCKTRHR